MRPILGIGAFTLALTLSCQDQPQTTAPTRGEVLAASLTPADPAARHLVVFAAERVPADCGQRVSALGGSVEAVLDSIGVAAVTGLSEAAAADLAAAADVRAVEADPITSPPEGDFASDASADQAASDVAVADATASPTAAQFYPRQWNLRAVFADQAWAAGFLGSRDVKVAILDTGIDYSNPDLAGLVDLDHSISFVPEDVTRHYPGRLPFSDLYWHGTAVASAVATNAKVLAGMNRYVTLLAVKVADSTNTHTVGRIINGIVYAADQGADVINVSRGSERDRRLDPGTLVAYERAVNYAFRKGALVVSVPFNDAVDLDHNGDLVRLPCEAANAICVAATGPTGAISVNGPWVDVDAPAPYTAFGRSAVSAAAPGGTGQPGQFKRFWALCTTTPSATTDPPACRTHQAIVQGAGTSFAAPTVAGLAALLVAQLGHGNPGLIRERILQTADDLGEPGTDPYYGRGRINVARALGVLP